MNKVNNSNIKERCLAAGGSFSGIFGFLGSYSVCHNLCMSIIAILAGIGITLKGMPLLFLQKIAMPFWIGAVTILLILIILKIKKRRCISTNNLVFNSGLIVAGIPFRPLEQYSSLFWFGGGALILTSISIFIKAKLKERKK